MDGWSEEIVDPIASDVWFIMARMYQPTMLSRTELNYYCYTRKANGKVDFLACPNFMVLDGIREQLLVYPLRVNISFYNNIFKYENDKDEMVQLNFD